MKRIPALFLFAALLACKPDPEPVDTAPAKDTAVSSAHSDTALKPGTDTTESASLRPVCGELEKDTVPAIALRYAKLSHGVLHGARHIQH